MAVSYDYYLAKIRCQQHAKYKTILDHRPMNFDDVLFTDDGKHFDWLESAGNIQTPFKNAPIRMAAFKNPHYQIFTA